MLLVNGNCRTISFKVISPQRMGVGELLEKAENVFLQLVFDNGVKGYGEIATWAVTRDYLPAEEEQAFHEQALPILYKQDGLEPAASMRALDEIEGHTQLKAGLEMALYDALGQHLHKPLYELLGGKKKPHIQLSYSVSLQDAVLELDELSNRYEEGYRIFKIKTGLLDLATEVERLKLFKREFPKAEVRVDFNEVADPTTFSQLFDFMLELGINYVEQPFPRGRDEALNNFRGRGALFVADESCKTYEDFQRILAQGIYGAVSLKIGKIGGFRQVMRLLEAASPVGILGYAGGTSESVLGVTAAVHFFCTRTNLLEGCDFYFPYLIIEPQGLTGGIIPQGGKLIPPDSPGTGCLPPAEWFR
jgi:muconate cycloisomerase